MANVTPEQLTAWRALEAQATPGPWSAEYEDGYYGLLDFKVNGVHYAISSKGQPSRDDAACRSDAEFIAAAREALPALLDEVEKLQRENQRLNAMLDAVQANNVCPPNNACSHLRTNRGYSECRACWQRYRDEFQLEGVSNAVDAQ